MTKFDQKDIGDQRDDNTIIPVYELLSHQGHGSYGYVFRARECKTGMIVAVKKFVLASMDGGVCYSTLREVALLQQLDHPNVVRMLGYVFQKEQLYIVLDYYDMNLKQYMSRTGTDGMTSRHIKSFMHQMLCGLEYCHLQGVIHRDLKPQNILINHQGNICITDFGLSKMVGLPYPNSTPGTVTLGYRAPEILLSDFEYTLPVDLWSLGCIFAEMMMMQQLFQVENEISLLMKIFSLLGTPDESSWAGVTKLCHYNPNFPKWCKLDLRYYIESHSPSGTTVSDLALDLLSSLFTYSPYKRINAVKALEHPYFYNELFMCIF